MALEAGAVTADEEFGCPGSLWPVPGIPVMLLAAVSPWDFCPQLSRPSVHTGPVLYWLRVQDFVPDSLGCKSSPPRSPDLNLSLCSLPCEKAPSDPLLPGLCEGEQRHRALRSPPGMKRALVTAADPRSIIIVLTLLSV